MEEACRLACNTLQSQTPVLADPRSKGGTDPALPLRKEQGDDDGGLLNTPPSLQLSEPVARFV